MCTLCFFLVNSVFFNLLCVRILFQNAIAVILVSDSWKPMLRTIKHGHQMDGWPLCARLCRHPEISLESNSVQTLQKPFGWDYEPKSPDMCMHARSSHRHVKDPVVHVNGLRTHPNNPACPKSARVSRVLKLNTIHKMRKKKKKWKKKRKNRKKKKKRKKKMKKKRKKKKRKRVRVLRVWWLMDTPK